jgi:uncharacterized protein
LEQKNARLFCVTAYECGVATLRQNKEDIGRVHGSDKERRKQRRRFAMILLILLLGLGVGVLVGLLGIGGGVVLVPAMVYLLRMDQHLAQGTSLLILLPPVGLGALLGYWKHSQVDVRAGIICAIGILVGGYPGSLIAIPLSPRHLKGLFGCFLMLTAVLLWRKRQPQKVPTSGQSGEAASG